MALTMAMNLPHIAYVQSMMNEGFDRMELRKQDADFVRMTDADLESRYGELQEECRVFDKKEKHELQKKELLARAQLRLVHDMKLSRHRSAHTLADNLSLHPFGPKYRRELSASMTARTAACHASRNGEDV